MPVRFLNGRFDCKISARDTAGALCAFDTIRTRPGGPPLHLHLEQDEWFFVQEGQFQARVGDETRELGPGDSFFGPRGIPHAFTMVSQTGRMLITFQPAGTMEAFFAAELVDPMSEEFRELSRQHGMEVVGPPLPL
jgi:mannose-6-phosphate isomerase-like protein (cupin superfamily)